MTHHTPRDPLQALEEWLDTQEAGDDTGELMLREDDIDKLWTVGCLARTHTPEAALRDAVHHARQAGWGWPPLALSLGISAAEARRRYSDHPERHSTARWWARFRNHHAHAETPRDRGPEAMPPALQLEPGTLPAQRAHPLPQHTRAQH